MDDVESRNGVEVGDDPTTVEEDELDESLAKVDTFCDAIGEVET